MRAASNRRGILIGKGSFRDVQLVGNRFSTGRQHTSNVDARLYVQS